LIKFTRNFGNSAENFLGRKSVIGTNEMGGCDKDCRCKCGGPARILHLDPRHPANPKNFPLPPTYPCNRADYHGNRRKLPPMQKRVTCKSTTPFFQQAIHNFQGVERNKTFHRPADVSTKQKLCRECPPRCNPLPHSRAFCEPYRTGKVIINKHHIGGMQEWCEQDTTPDDGGFFRREFLKVLEPVAHLCGATTCHKPHEKFSPHPDPNYNSRKKRGDPLYNHDDDPRVDLADRWNTFDVVHPQKGDPHQAAPIFAGPADVRHKLRKCEDAAEGLYERYDRNRTNKREYRGKNPWTYMRGWDCAPKHDIRIREAVSDDSFETEQDLDFHGQLFH